LQRVAGQCENMPMNFRDRLAESWPAAQWCDLTVVTAVSGGADSVALVHALAALRRREAARRPVEGRLAAAHFNHLLRGAAAEADERFVRTLCERLAVPLVVGRAEGEFAIVGGGQGLEGAARRARYRFFSRAADQLGARFVATAHTADDQVETILHRILRGTGIAGLAGIPRTRPLTAAATLIRPMLSICRAEVLAYLADVGQEFCQDATNEDVSLTRNRIRQELLPLLTRGWGAQVHQAIWRLGALAGQVQEIIDEQVQALLAQALVGSTSDSVTLDAARLGASRPYLVRELLLLVWRRQNWPLSQMGYRQWCELAELSQSREQAVRTLPGGIRAETAAGKLTLTVAAP
jgi:tRNA(Ile)-lysidine synthase